MTSIGRNGRNLGDPAPDGIAIVGLAGRFPGAPDAGTFWRNLSAGVESISRIPETELEDGFDAATRSGSNYVRARGLLDGIDLFDAPFFGMHRREAELTDPQHRILLELSWEALEDAGYDPQHYAGAIGVYLGCSISSYFMRNVLGDRRAIETFTSDYQVGSFAELMGGGSDFLATRVAYKLDLRGPAMTVQSACSTSLLAVAQACHTLWLGQADMMLAGAASISLPQHRGYLHQAGGMVSSDGHCRTFDAAASGTVFGAGAGIVVLKRLADALADGDSIAAVIRGVGLTNDGSAKAGFTAPGPNGQAAAITRAYAMAGFAPESIGYVECHGTATPLGDPIEVRALASAFAAGDGAEARCFLGSVKPNVGHLDVAAGMAGLIKTALALREGTIPPTLHFTTPNPGLDLTNSPFTVATGLTAWPGDGPRRAGVSAFGVGGTNVHLALEQAPDFSVPAPTTDSQLLVLSARTPEALQTARHRLGAFLSERPGIDLAAAAATLQSGRRAFAHRAAIRAASVHEAVAKLAAPAAGAGKAMPAATHVGFLFPGQGAQYAGMGAGLYRTEPVYREAVDRCAEIVAPQVGFDIRALMSAGTAPEGGFTATAVVQPALFIIEYALARLWTAWGLKPAAMIGHSVGEFVAATLAGVFRLEDALLAVAERGRLMQALPPGVMLAVRLGESELGELLDERLGIASLNGPLQSVASGPADAIAALEARLQEREIVFKRLATSHAFHSPMMDPLREPLAATISKMSLREPERPYISSVTGRWIDAGDATSPEYWATHARATVRFSDALATLRETSVDALLEVGPGTSLAAAVHQNFGRASTYAVVSSLPAASDDEAGELLEAAGKLWTAGVPLDWRAIRTPRDARRISLPTYPFERSHYWIEPSLPEPRPNSIRSDATVETRTVHDDQSIGSRDSATDRIARDLAALLEELSGEDVAPEHAAQSFLELGFDSLFLGRFVQKVNAQFGVEVTFRQLLGDLPTIVALAAHVAAVHPELSDAATHRASDAPASVSPPMPANAQAAGSTYEAVVREQLQAMQQLMRDQLDALNGRSPAVHAAQPSAIAAPKPSAAPAGRENTERFDAFRIVAPTSTNELSEAQRMHIDGLVERVTTQTAKSKAYTQRHRSVLADPRVAAGFRPEWKEMVYPIVCDRAAGSRLWDIDGNEYIDILNGFGQTAFGHAPEFVVDAVRAQLDRGFAIGPQTELAGEVAELFCAMTGNERVTFCNTGSEAVMAALRLARAVTGRDRVAVFSGSYHGQFDEVLVKGARSSERSIPIAPGIPAQAVANVAVLAYGAPESLAWIRVHAAELAAVVVEPVQSRHPALAPAEFLRELRAITENNGTALVFDEVVTGFRMHPAGMQTIFGVRADMATYGKVVGGGMPIGILAGKARFMDALDGGMWQYGDGSVPEVSPTFFAGTFVRHPLAMAAVLAVLRHMQSQGPALQERLTARTAGLVGRINADLERRGITGRIETYGSLFYFNFSGIERLAALLYYHLRIRGVYIQEGFPCFLTTAHTEADVEAIYRGFVESLDALQAAGIFAGGAAVSEDLALTEEQTEIWLAAQLCDGASCAFNESLTLHLDGTLDDAAFSHALEGVVARHEALRARYAPTGETMHVASENVLSYETTDLSALSPAKAEAALEEFVARDARTPFDLVAGPVVRGRMFRFSPQRHAFVFTVHHIAADGWSINVILTELAALYAAAETGAPASLPAPLSFREYARRSAKRDGAATSAIERYWRAQFERPVEALDLPTDRPRAALRTFEGATLTFKIERERYLAIKKAGARSGCTLFVTLLGAFAALLGRLSGRDDVVVGIPAAGQALLNGETLVGHCVDFLPIRANWNRTSTFDTMLGEIKATVLGAYEHQSTTLGTLVRTLAPVRNQNRLPLTEIQFNLERVTDDFTMGTLHARVASNPKAHVNFDLFFNVVEAADGLRVDCDYNTDLYDAATIDGWFGAFRAILDEITADATQRVNQPSPAFEALRAVPLAASERFGDPFSHDATIHGLFEARAAACPDAIAAVCDDARLTYRELDERANRLAHHLIARTGTGDAPIGVALERSIDMLVALLATLKAGRAYVPLDPRHPAARRQLVLTQARVAAVITDAASGVMDVPADAPSIDLDADAAAIAAAPPHAPAVSRAAIDLAYVIFTSGSTGVPKGVEISHRSVVNLLEAMRLEPGLTSEDVFLAVTTVAFDIAALELFLPLITGATVAIARNDDVADGFRLLERLREYGATAMQATPALWRILLEAGFRAAPGFRMLCGGEPLRHDVAARLLEGDGRLWNMYGPTETTIWSSCATVERGLPITVGAPIANTQFYVLDEGNGIVAAGDIGELHIAGEGLARGYLGAPALDAEKFVTNPFGPGKLYRTGDSARMLADGRFEILGRRDGQVKLRGFRVELGEIEAALAEHDGLAASAVALRDAGAENARLVGYYVERMGRTVPPAELAQFLTQRVPNYMIPAIWQRLEALPLSANGKLDRKALPDPDVSGAPLSTGPTASTPLEASLAQIWSEVLELDRVATDADLFALGADSIQIFAITARANRQGMKLMAKDLFKHRTVAALARHLEPV